MGGKGWESMLVSETGWKCMGVGKSGWEHDIIEPNSNEEASSCLYYNLSLPSCWSLFLP